jgi:hypothetical protein
MRGHWLNFENTQSEKAIMGNACNPKIVSSKSCFVCCWPASRCHSVAVAHFGPIISMRTSSLILLVLLVTLSGCVVTYGEFPNATKDSLPKDHVAKPLFYHVEPIATMAKLVDETKKESVKGNARVSAFMSMVVTPGYYPFISQIDPFGQPGYREVARTLTASGMFSDLIETQNPPEVGVFCEVEFEPTPPSTAVQYYIGSQAVFFLGYITALVPAFSLLPYYTDEGGTTAIYSLYRDGQLARIYRYSIKKKGAGWIVLLPFAWINYFTTDLADAVQGATFRFLIDAYREGCFGDLSNCAPSYVAPKTARTLPQPKERGDFGQRIEEPLQPILKWDPFPGLGEDLTYDLSIWRATVGWRQVHQGSVVYERQGITQPSHQIEMPLEPSTHYLWAVRAHFQRDGQKQITPWSYEIAAGAPDEPRYYHFWTPTSLDIPQ